MTISVKIPADFVEIFYGHKHKQRMAAEHFTLLCHLWERHGQREFRTSAHKLAGQSIVQGWEPSDYEKALHRLNSHLFILWRTPATGLRKFRLSDLSQCAGAAIFAAKQQSQRRHAIAGVSEGVGGANGAGLGR